MLYCTTTLESPWKRIRLVVPTAADDEATALCRIHPTTRRYLTFLPEQMSTEEAKERRESRAKDPFTHDLHIYWINDDQTTTFAGMTGIFHADETHLSCESGIIVHPDFHGKNIATEAFYIIFDYYFGEGRFHRITFETGADNVGMKGWLEKVAGARLESQRKEAWKTLNGFADVAGYAILENEWRDHVKPRLEKRMGGL